MATQNNPPRASKIMKRNTGMRKMPASDGAAVFRPGINFATSKERAPWWLVLFRMLAAALLILAFARPSLAPSAAESAAGGRTLIVIDDGWTSAPFWSDVRNAANAAVAEAERANAPVFLLLTAVSFWFEDRLGVGPPVYNMIRFARFPVTIYHPMVRALLSWVVPFAFAAFYPATLFLRSTEFRVFAALTPLMGAACLAAALWVFERGSRRYASTGH